MTGLLAIAASLALAPVSVVELTPIPPVTDFREALRQVSGVIRPDDPEVIDWRILGGLDLETGRPSAILQRLNGQRVRIAAFIVPLEDDMQQADEFLLVPYFGACVHTPPPPPNQMVYVKMKDRKTVKIGWWDPVMFEGILHLRQVESPYGASYYEMEGLASEPYKPATK